MIYIYICILIYVYLFRFLCRSFKIYLSIFQIATWSSLHRRIDFRTRCSFCYRYMKTSEIESNIHNKIQEYTICVHVYNVYIHNIHICIWCTHVLGLSQSIKFSQTCFCKRVLTLSEVQFCSEAAGLLATLIFESGRGFLHHIIDQLSMQSFLKSVLTVHLLLVTNTDTKTFSALKTIIFQ